MNRFTRCLALTLPAVAVGLSGVLGCSRAQPSDPSPGVAGPKGSFDWPQWQGPDRTAVSKETGLLKEWPKDGPPLAWKAKGLGGGDSAPSVAAGRLFGMSNRGDDEVVWALSEADGKELWAAPLGPAVKQRMPQSKEGPGCTPTVDGDRLYVLGMGGDLACLQVKDGKILWQLSLTKEFGGRVPMWSYRESPLVDGDKLVCTPGGPDATIVALDKATGKTVWKSEVRRAAAGAGLRLGHRPRLRRAAPVRAAHRRGRSSGWRRPTARCSGKYDPVANRMGINCSTPVYHDGMVFASSAYGAGGGLVKLAQGRDGRGQGRGGVLHQEDAEPPRRHDRRGRLPVRGQRRQRGRVARLPGLQDRQGPVGRRGRTPS